MPLPSDFKEKLLAELKLRGVKGDCELCGRNNWGVSEQAVALNLTDFSGALRIPTPNVPCAALICNNCGNVRTFALGALNLMPTLQKEGGK